MDRIKLKDQAKKAISGKILVLLAIFLLVYLATYAIGYLTFGAGSILVAGSVQISFAMIFLAIVNKNRTPVIEDTLKGFRDGNFGRGLVGYVRYLVFTTLWMLLFIIPGFVKSLAYSQMFYLMADHPKLEPGEAQKKSIAMMDGHKGELFVLYLSFIPWMLLVCITFGLAAIYVVPYMNATLANYYNYLKKAS
jgi:uncharacterized membrane protein